jgi:hypothetical protein
VSAGVSDKDMAEKTLNEVLRELEERGVAYSKIASGVYIGKLKTYLFCKCDGNGEIGQLACQQCGDSIFCCMLCAKKGLVGRCPKCSGMFRTRRRNLAKLLGMPWEEVEQKIRTGLQHLETPIDFDALVAEGKLTRLSATKYKLLVNMDDLPEHVAAQITGQESSKEGLIIHFRRHRRNR